ncbi:putative C2 domain-containing protein [Medicago truncatula]|uniref:Putative C2 domain-containing protein n=1 Tax=Medicago truncatula TaxID=3880 RepID=G7JAP6_MEDTR|nr:hypothetical protein MTR_3g070160 [Medicago truncatula]RHN68370.1 putative C2 domain-containing protein [Medicago truncatula]
MTTKTVLPIKKRKPEIQAQKCSITRVSAPSPSPKPLNNANQKSKSILTEEFKVALHVMIYKAEGIDNPANYPSVNNRAYNVVYWLKPDEEASTKIAVGVNPEWNQDDMVVLENLDDEVFLNVEVQRFDSLLDPGTSSGKVVIGRVKIPVPMEFYRRKVGSFPLLRSDGNGNRLEGSILLAMRLQRIKGDSESTLQYYADDLFFEDDVVN